MGGGEEEEAEEARQRDEGLARLIGAYLRLFGLAQGDTDVRTHVCAHTHLSSHIPTHPLIHPNQIHHPLT